jgi:hypothetical protein
LSDEKKAAAPAGTEDGVIVTWHTDNAPAGDFSQARKAKNKIFALAKTTLTIPKAWRLLELDFPPKDGRDSISVCSPLRPESNPSFSIYDEGRAWKDHGGKKGGDVIEFIKEVLEVDYAGVRMWLLRHMNVAPEASGGILWPGDLVKGHDETWRILAERRGMLPFSVHLMVHFGLLRFVKATWDGRLRKCYVVTDDVRRGAEIRSCDGTWFGKRKAYPLAGVIKKWPVGTAILKNSSPDAAVLLVEGATDFLTAWDLVARGALWNQWVPVSLLGASLKDLDPEAAKLFQGRHVRLVPHGDEDGDRWRDHWTKLLSEIECSVSSVILDRKKDLTDHHRLGTVNTEELFKPW